MVQSQSSIIFFWFTTSPKWISALINSNTDFASECWGETFLIVFTNWYSSSLSPLRFFLCFLSLRLLFVRISIKKKCMGEENSKEITFFLKKMNKLHLFACWMRAYWKRWWSWFFRCSRVHRSATWYACWTIKQCKWY